MAGEHIGTLILQDYNDAGASGLNSAVSILYKRFATSPAIPTTTSTYTFATGTVTGQDNGWTYTIPTTDGNPLWAIRAMASAVAPAASDTILFSEWSSPIKLVEDGTIGSNGTSGYNTAILFLYQRKSTAPATTDIADPITYTFSTKVITNYPTSTGAWTTTIPSGTDPLYLISAIASSITSTDTVDRSEWGTPQILAQNGAAGSNGANGTNGTNGKTYVGVINAGVRSIVFDAAGSNPSPAQTAFSCQLYEDGSLVTPATYAWTATGHLSGTSSTSTFTPTCAGTFSASNSDSVSLTLTYAGQTVKLTIPISATRIGTTGNAGTAGTDSTIYYLEPSAYVSFKDVVDAATTGNHTAVTFTGKRSVGSTITSGIGFLTIQKADNSYVYGSAVTAQSLATPYAFTPATTSATNYFTAKMYNQATISGATLYDTVVIPVVFKGATGSTGGTGATGLGAITIALTNNAHVIPTDSAGANPVYTGSGTDVYVYEGSTALTYDGVGTANSSWKITSATGTGITVGSLSDGGVFATYGVASAITADTAYIVFTVNGKRADGTTFSGILTRQAFSKGKAGATGGAGAAGKTYNLVITNGIRTILYNLYGLLPTPAMVAFGMTLYENGASVTPTSYSWTVPASSMLSGTSATSAFTPVVASTYDTGKMDNRVNLSVVYGGITYIESVPIAIVREGPILPWVQEWDTGKTTISGNYIITPKIFVGSGGATPTGLTFGFSPSTGAASSDLTGYTAGVATFSLTKDYFELIGTGTNRAGLSVEGLTDSDVRFWSGTSRTNKATAPFRITQAGYLYANNADIAGSITTPNAGMTSLGFPVSVTSVTNLLSNGDLRNGTTGWVLNGSTISAANSTLSITGNGSVLNPSAYQAVQAAVIGRKYYCKFRARATNSSCLSIRVHRGGVTSILQSAPTINTWYPLSVVITATDVSTGFNMYHYYVDIATANGKVMEVQYALLIDLTTLFGAGSEPTAAQMDSYLGYEFTNSWFNGTTSPNPIRIWAGSSLSIDPLPSFTVRANGSLSLIDDNGVAQMTFNPIDGMIGFGSGVSMSWDNITDSPYGDKILLTDLEAALSNQFLVDSGTTYINGAGLYAGSVKANSLDVRNLTVSYESSPGVFIPTFSISDTGEVNVKGSMASYDYSAGLTGWNISKDGTAEFNNATIRSDLLLPNAGMTNSGYTGDVVALPNLISNGSFLNTTGWSTTPNMTVSVANNELSELASAQYAGSVQTIASHTTYRTHKLYFAAYVKVTSFSIFLVLNDGVGQTTVPATILNAYQHISSIHTVSGTSSTLYFKLQDNNAAGWQTQYMKYAVVIDLTAVFGVGLEPTAVQMDEWLTNDYQYGWFDGTGELNPVRIWAGQEFDSKNFAPFRVYQDGSIYVSHGIFEGVFSGTIAIGDIEIVDTNLSVDGYATIKFVHDAGYLPVLISADETHFDNLFYLGIPSARKFLWNSTGTFITNSQLKIGQVEAFTGKDVIFPNSATDSLMKFYENKYGFDITGVAGARKFSFLSNEVTTASNFVFAGASANNVKVEIDGTAIINNELDFGSSGTIVRIQKRTSGIDFVI